MEGRPGRAGCVILVTFFHYFSLTNFFWMLVEGKYESKKNKFDIPHFFTFSLISFCQLLCYLIHTHNFDSSKKSININEQLNLHSLILFLFYMLSNIFKLNRKKMKCIKLTRRKQQKGKKYQEIEHVGISILNHDEFFL